MGSAKVVINEIDLTSQVPMFPGVYGGIVLPSRKGPLEPYLATSVAELKRVFTPNEKIDVVDDLSFFSAQTYLESSDKLWVSRAINAALYGGIEVADCDGENTSYLAGEDDPETDHVFKIAEIFTSVFATDLLTVTQDWATGTPVEVSTTGTLPAPLVVSTTYFVINISATTIKLAASLVDALAGTEITLTSDGTGVHTITPNNNAILAIVGSNPGAWNNNIAIQLYNYRAAEAFTTTFATDILTVTQNWATGLAVLVSSAGTLPAPLAENTAYYVINMTATTIKLALTYANAVAGTEITLTDDGTGIHTISLVEDKAKEADIFYIGVYKDGGATPVEEWYCSRKQIKDGYGRNAYVEDVLEGSNYIRAVDNTAVLDTVLPLDQLTSLSLACGSDGATVTDSHMIIALNKMSNPSDIPLTILMDGGWTTVAYQQALYGMGASRNDCYVHLSVPYASEASSNYLNDVVKYRRITLNANTSFGGLCSPHVKILDVDNDRRIYVSPDGFFAAQMSETGSNNEMWIPGAGYTYGIIEVLDLLRKYTEPEMDYLYDNGVNPIKFTPGRGIAIWGQKTLYSQPSYLQNSSVRMMLIVIEPAIKLALESYLWVGNTDASRATVKTLLTSYMEWIQARGGVVRFQVICDRSNNLDADIAAGVMVVWVLAEPVIPVELIKCTIGITKSGHSFDAAAQSL